MFLLCSTMQTTQSIVEEGLLNLVARLKSLRCHRVIFPALILAATASDAADASNMCLRAEQYAPVSNPVVARGIEERLQAIPIMKNHQVRALNRSFAIAWQDEEECRKRFACHHVLFDVRNDEARVAFVYRGTGTFMVPTSTSMRDREYDDDYSAIGFETQSFTYITVSFPRRHGPLRIEDPSPIQGCTHLRER